LRDWETGLFVEKTRPRRTDFERIEAGTVAGLLGAQALTKSENLRAELFARKLPLEAQHVLAHRFGPQPGELFQVLLAGIGSVR
jgi:hypothetical protein